jgi:hypothetical protein
MQGGRRALDHGRVAKVARFGAVLVALCLSMSGSLRAQPCCGKITPNGQRMAAFLDSTDVDHLWIAGHRVDWRTGKPASVTYGVGDTGTHCGGYVAAVAQKLRVYILRTSDPFRDPEANLQAIWLRRGGSGWRRLAGDLEAQEEANRGNLVVAAFENPDPDRTGHIAIVRPSEKSLQELDSEGPQEAQAGETNSPSMSIAGGFSYHSAAWAPGGRGDVRYFAHAVKWSGVNR